MKTQESVTPLQKEIEVPAELAFGVAKVAKDLWAVRLVLYKGSKVLDTRTGAGTSLGHAIGEAEDLVSHWNLNVLSETAEEYFKTVRTI